MLHEERPEFSGLSRRHHSSFPYSPSTAQRGMKNDSPSPSDARGVGRPPSLAAGQAGSADSADRTDLLFSLKRDNPELAAWMKETVERKHNHIGVTECADGKPILFGTLLFQISEDHTDIMPLHFWVQRNKIVTLHSDYRLSIRMQAEPWSEKLQRCKEAPEALFVILNLILQIFHVGLDAFEARLGDLENNMRNNNRAGLMNLIFERRYDLLHWNHLFIPIQEIYGAAKEAFLDTLSDHEEFKRLEYKLERLQDLLIHYASEIDTLLMMDDAISNFRGNDIMKTLTIFTALFMPATVIGAIWGMNFDQIPYASTGWGFAGAVTLIIVITGIIYWWLRRKGWTGDLLYARKPREIIAADSSSSSSNDGGRSGRAGGRSVRVEERQYKGGASRESTTGIGDSSSPAPLPSRSRKQ